MLKTVVLHNIFVETMIHFFCITATLIFSIFSTLKSTATLNFFSLLIKLMHPSLKKEGPNLLKNCVHRVSLTKVNQQAVCKVFPDTAKSRCSFIKVRVTRGQSKSMDDWMSLLTGLYVFEVQQKAVQRAQGTLRKMSSILLEHIHSWNYTWFRITLMTKEKTLPADINHSVF